MLRRARRHAAIDGLPWAAAFALGAIVSPTDPLAATTIGRRLGVPRRLTAVIEGESLVNDGTALVAYRTAVGAAAGGSFDLLDATGDFVVNVIGGIAIGFVAAFLVVKALKQLVGDDVVGVVVSLAAGYIAYIPAEEIGVSGVLAAVVIGLVVGYKSPGLSTPASRRRGLRVLGGARVPPERGALRPRGLRLPGILSARIDRRSSDRTGDARLLVVIATRLLWVNTGPYLLGALDRGAGPARAAWAGAAGRYGLERAARLRPLAAARRCHRLPGGATYSSS